MQKRQALWMISSLLILTVTSSGCTFIFQKGRRQDTSKIVRLQNEYSQLQDEYYGLEDELSELEKAKAELERRLSQEIDDREVKVEMMGGNLVITFVAEVLFASGKIDLKSESLNTLQKVAKVLNTTVRDLNVGIEGHTDNIPIKYSGWKSNWELSSHRAMSVLHFLVEDESVSPERLSATGFGEYQPVASNTTKEGRAQNRRVEIVILPKIQKEAGSLPQKKENLK